MRLDVARRRIISAASGQRPAASGHSVQEGGVNLPESLTELLIFAREHGGDELPEVRIAIRTAERKIDGLRSARRRRESRSGRNHCMECGFRCPGLLCWSCNERAPEHIRNAFLNAQGLDGMRAAVDAVKAYAARRNERRVA